VARICATAAIFDDDIVEKEINFDNLSIALFFVTIVPIDENNSITEKTKIYYINKVSAGNPDMRVILI
jgi:hypothetical protein